MSFAQSKKWVFSLPNNVSSSNVQPQQKRKVDREKKMRAPDIRTVVRDQIASFDDLLIVEGVFHVVVQVFAAHFGKALMCVSQSFLNVFSVAAELRVRALLLYLRHNPRETFVWGKGRVVYVAFITSSRGPKSNDTRVVVVVVERLLLSL